MPVQKYAWYTAVPDNQGGSFMVFRLAEMYLIFAEASLKTGRDQGLALGYINAIRARTGVEMPPVAVLTEDVVRRERRVELAFEGLRYFDIKRWDIGATALNGPVLGARQEALGAVNQATGKVTWSGPNVSVENRTFRPERKYLWPIPQSEINLNSNVTQNPGYN